MTPQRVALHALVVACAGFLLIPVAAADPLGLYVGGGVGQSTVRSEQMQFTNFTGGPLDGPVSLSGHDAGWKLAAGLRPISLAGAEIEYIDFGHPTASATPYGFGLGYSADVRARATAAFGVLYAPIPVPLFDLYGKAGVARLQTTASATGALGCFPPLTCPLVGLGQFHRDQSSARLAYGAGAQMTLGRFAVRAEYERINASEGDPDLLSVGITLSF